MSTKPGRFKRLLENLALSAVVFLLCVLVCEIVLRLNGYGNLEIYDPDPRLYWRLKPRQDCFTKIDHRPVHINSHGTRGPEFDPVKAANTIRILSLGDSRTFGWGLNEAETYSAKLEQLLAAQYGGAKRVEVINAGVNAWSYPQLLTYFRDPGVKYRPDFVIVGEANLWTQFSDRNPPEFVRQMMWRVRVKNFLRRFALYHYVMEVKLEKIYAEQRKKFIPVGADNDPLFKEQQQRDPDALFRTSIEELCRLALTNGAQPVLIYIPWSTDLHVTNPPASLRVKRDVHDRLGVPLLDLAPDLQEGETLYLTGDPVHLNARGNEVVSRRLFEALSAMTGP